MNSRDDCLKVVDRFRFTGRATMVTIAAVAKYWFVVPPAQQGAAAGGRRAKRRGKGMNGRLGRGARS